mgnify:CR=1 FL=1
MFLKTVSSLLSVSDRMKYDNAETFPIKEDSYNS